MGVSFVGEYIRGFDNLVQYVSMAFSNERVVSLRISEARHGAMITLMPYEVDAPMNEYLDFIWAQIMHTRFDYLHGAREHGEFAGAAEMTDEEIEADARQDADNSLFLIELQIYDPDDPEE